MQHYWVLSKHGDCRVNSLDWMHCMSLLMTEKCLYRMSSRRRQMPAGGGTPPAGAPAAAFAPPGPYADPANQGYAPPPYSGQPQVLSKTHLLAGQTAALPRLSAMPHGPLSMI